MATPVIETNTFTTDRASTALDENFVSKAINTSRTKNLLIHTGLTGATDIELYAPIAFDPYRQVVICSDSAKLSGGTIFKKTTDGTNFTTIADRSQAPFTTLATEQGAGSVVLFSIICLDDGTYLLCAGKSTEHTEVQGAVPNARIFRSTDGGATWTGVQDLLYGYVSPLQSWYAIGTHVACVEYGPKGGVTGDTARQVFLSHDSGATWTLAYDYETLADRHLHAVCFDPTDATYTTLYVSHGDEKTTRGIDKLVYNSGTEVLDLTSVSTAFQPTGCVIYGNNIYWSSDNYRQPTVLKHNVATDTFETALIMPTLNAGTSIKAYNWQENECFWYNIREFGGVYYVVGHSETSNGRYSAGVYASLDMEKWTCVARVLSSAEASGYGFVGGVVGDKLFVTRKTTTALGQVIDVPAFRTLDMTVTDTALTNYVDVNYDPSFETGDTTGWTRENFISSIEIISTDGYHGSKCLKCNITDAAGTSASIQGPQFSPTGTGYSWSANDVVTARFWAKFPAGFPYTVRPRIRFSTIVEDTDIDTVSYPTSIIPSISGEWQPFEITFKMLTDFSAGYARLSLHIDASYSAATYFLIDSVEYFVNANPVQGRDFTLGAVANDTSAASLLGCGAEWTTTFRWCPLTAVNNYLFGGTLAIARIEGVAGGYLDLYWDSADTLFKLTNGTDTIASTETYLPYFYDSCVVAVQGDATGSAVTINTPYTGTITFGDFSDTALGSQPETIKFGRNASVYSYGAFGILRAYNSKLSEANLLLDFERLNISTRPILESKQFRHRRII